MKCICKKDFQIDLSQMQTIFFKENCEYEYKTTPHEETGIPIYYLDVLKSTTGWDWFPFNEKKFKLNFNTKSMTLLRKKEKEHSFVKE
jgi:hypothetical protein